MRLFDFVDWQFIVIIKDSCDQNNEGYNQSVTLEKQEEIENNHVPPAGRKPILQKILPPLGGLLLLAGLVLWWNFPVFKVLAVGTPTPTPRPPTFTPAPTRTTTPSATPTHDRKPNHGFIPGFHRPRS